MILFCLIEPGLLKRILTITLYAKINSFMYIAMMMAFSEWFISNSTEKTARFRLCLELRVSEGRDEASGFLYVAHKESEALSLTSRPSWACFPGGASVTQSWRALLDWSFCDAQRATRDTTCGHDDGYDPKIMRRGVQTGNAETFSLL